MATGTGMAYGHSLFGVWNLQIFEIRRFCFAESFPYLFVFMEFRPLALQLPQNFGDLENSGCAHRMHRAEKPARKVG